mgnify:FL=1
MLFRSSYAILGFAFGLILYRSRVTPVRVFAAAFFEFVEACTLNTLWLHFMYGMEWKYLFTIRLIKCIVSLGINTVLLFIFMKAFSKIISSVLTPASVSRS